MSTVVDPRLLRRCDWPLLVLVVAVFGLSLPTVYSATLAAGHDQAWHTVQRQLAWFAVGLLALLLVNTLDYHQFPQLTRTAYWCAVVGLVVVLAVGREVNGARSWLELGPIRMQPSEFAKVAVILALARLFDESDAPASDWQILAHSVMALSLPLLLILAQPDLGTSLTFIAVWLMLLWWCGARWWQLVGIVLLGLLAFALLWHLDLLQPYQKARIAVLFDPGADPRGQGYNLRQSLIAVGSGGLTGQGWLQGTQTHLRFLPEARTDFIFAVLCEERGLVGAAVLLLLYAAMIWRCLAIIGRADTRFGRIAGIGCVTILLLHVLLNVGMVVGLLPITGLPLPFFSYGGSNLLTNCVLVGMLLNIGMRRGGINY